MHSRRTRQVRPPLTDPAKRPRTLDEAVRKMPMIPPARDHVLYQLIHYYGRIGWSYAWRPTWSWRSDVVKPVPPQRIRGAPRRGVVISPASEFLMSKDKARVCLMSHLKVRGLDYRAAGMRFEWGVGFELIFTSWPSPPFTNANVKIQSPDPRPEFSPHPFLAGCASQRRSSTSSPADFLSTSDLHFRGAMRLDLWLSGSAGKPWQLARNANASGLAPSNRGRWGGVRDGTLRRGKGFADPQIAHCSSGSVATPLDMHCGRNMCSPAAYFIIRSLAAPARTRALAYAKHYDKLEARSIVQTRHWDSRGARSLLEAKYPPVTVMSLSGWAVSNVKHVTYSSTFSELRVRLIVQEEGFTHPHEELRAPTVATLSGATISGPLSIMITPYMIAYGPGPAWRFFSGL
ncbi:hypothetical protein FB451DRAFT_1500738 [Mycena latifolia]|nr:hypothetical protein FB451DRAFT_1500738 [Mycena latifolia]